VKLPPSQAQRMVPESPEVQGEGCHGPVFPAPRRSLEGNRDASPSRHSLAEWMTERSPPLGTPGSVPNGCTPGTATDSWQCSVAASYGQEREVDVPVACVLPAPRLSPRDTRGPGVGAVAASRAGPSLVRGAARDDWTPLHLGAFRGDAAAVRALIRTGADLAATPACGTTALHLAALAGEAAGLQALLAGGADPAATDDDGWTPLHFAAKCGHEAAVQLLLEGGARPDAVDASRETALHKAARGGHAAAVRALVEGGAEHCAADGDLWTPLHLAAVSGQLDTVRALLEARADANAAKADRWTALHLAAFNAQGAAAQILLEGGGAAGVVNGCGQTPLDVARAEALQVLRCAA